MPQPPEPANPAADPAVVPKAATVDEAAEDCIWHNDVRNLSPRQMSALCGELFLATMISCDEYLIMSFQPELHPDYDQTIGALIGEQADPDRPRDYVQRWTERLDFEIRHNAEDTSLITQARNILSVLRRLDSVRAARLTAA